MFGGPSNGPARIKFIQSHELDSLRSKLAFRLQILQQRLVRNDRLGGSILERGQVFLILPQRGPHCLVDDVRQCSMRVSRLQSIGVLRQNALVTLRQAS
jgi:hypothetical protein